MCVDVLVPIFPTAVVTLDTPTGCEKTPVTPYLPILCIIKTLIFFFLFFFLNQFSGCKNGVP